MWDNREGKRNPQAPDFKCKNKECGGVIWPLRSAAPATAAPGSAPARPEAGGAVQPGMPSCPICGGPMWDDRLSKRNPRAPDFKCRNRPRFKGGEGCEGVIWPPREGQSSPYPPPGGSGGAAARARPGAASTKSAPPPHVVAPPPDDADFDPSFGPPDDDDLPF